MQFSAPIFYNTDRHLRLKSLDQILNSKMDRFQSFLKTLEGRTGHNETPNLQPTSLILILNEENVRFFLQHSSFHPHALQAHEQAGL